MSEILAESSPKTKAADSKVFFAATVFSGQATDMNVHPTLPLMRMSFKHSV